MTEHDDRELVRDTEAFSDEVQGALKMLLEDEIRSGWAGNALAWTATVAAAFALNILLLILVTGGS